MANNDRRVLRLEIACKPLHWQLSAITQVFNSFSSSLPALESLEIGVYQKDWQDEIEVTQWRDFLHPFTSVNKMSLKSEDSVRFVAPALQKLAEERGTGVLLSLKNLFLRTYNWQPSGPGKEAMEQFIGARQPYGHPVAVYHWNTKSGVYLRLQRLIGALYFQSNEYLCRLLIAVSSYLFFSML